MSFTVHLSPSGHSFPAAPGQRLLDAGIAQGLGLPYSCRTGICGTCRARVEDGVVDAGEVSTEVLSAADRAAGDVMLCRATALSDCRVAVRELDRSIRPKVFPCRVAALERAADDVMVLRLRVPMNQRLRIAPGQYIEFILKDGRRRSYSVANAAPHDGLEEIELHIRHLPGGAFTDTVFSSLKERDILRFEGPFGSFHLRTASRRPMVMLATGTGFAPVKAMLEWLRAQAPGPDAHPPVSVYWGGRNAADLYQAELAVQWASEMPNVSFTPVLSGRGGNDNDNGGNGGAWHGRTGYVQDAALQDHPDLSGHDVYACGSPAMVDAARRALMQRAGLPADAFFADAFFTAKDRAGLDPGSGPA